MSLRVSIGIAIKNLANILNLQQQKKDNEEIK